MYAQKIRPWLSLAHRSRSSPRRATRARLENRQCRRRFRTRNQQQPHAIVRRALCRARRRARQIFSLTTLGCAAKKSGSTIEDLINPQNSFDKLAGLTSESHADHPSARASTFLPTVALSYGEAFHTEDPRIGTGAGEPTLLAPSRAYQLVIAKSIKKTEFKITLKHVTNSQELAKIDPDTGLQENEGPSLNRVDHRFAATELFRKVRSMCPTRRPTPAIASLARQRPKRPRFIWDTVATEDHLPFGLHARCEFEYVRAKPVGDGFTGPAVPEFRGAFSAPSRTAA